MPRLANYFFSFIVMCLFFALSAVFFMRNALLERSSWVYGDAAPLMGSMTLDLVIRPWAGVVFVLLALAVLAKDFLQKSLSLCFKVNCALFIVGAALFLFLSQYALSPV